MNDPGPGLSTRAAQLRLAFDRAFAAAPPAVEAQTEEFIGIRVGTSPYALRLSEIGGLHAMKATTRVPAANPALLGIAGFRGAVLPVYRLSALLGGIATEAPRWLTVASGAATAFAFEGFERHLQILPDDILPRESHESGPKFVRAFARADGKVWPILHLPTIVDTIKAGFAAALKKEG